MLRQRYKKNAGQSCSQKLAKASNQQTVFQGLRYKGNVKEQSEIINSHGENGQRAGNKCTRISGREQRETSEYIYTGRRAGVAH